MATLTFVGLDLSGSVRGRWFVDAKPNLSDTQVSLQLVGRVSAARVQTADTVEFCPASGTRARGASWGGFTATVQEMARPVTLVRAATMRDSRKPPELHF